MGFLNSFEAFANKTLVPVAAKLNSQRHLAAVRDAFILAGPITMTGAICVMLVHVFLLPGAQFSISRTLIPAAAELVPIFNMVNQGTIECLSIFVIFLIARNLARTLGKDDLLAGLLSLAVFFIIYPKTDGAFAPNWFGAQGLFVAMIFGIIVGELFCFLSGLKALQVKLPDSVPPAVSRTFMALFPMMIVIVTGATIAHLFAQAVEGGVHQFIYDVLASPLRDLGQSLWTMIILELFKSVLWLFGIHGPNTTAAIQSALFAEAGEANLLHVNAGGSMWATGENPVPYTLTGHVPTVFGTVGGSGMTIGLIVAIFLVSKREDYKAIAKLSVAPGLFNINESMIFGIPIVLNPIFMIPFILVPIINILIGYMAILMGIIPMVWNTGVPWTCPGILLPFLATGGNWIAGLIGVLNIVVATVVYFPFVLLSNGQIETE